MKYQINTQFVCKRPFSALVLGTGGISSCYCYHGPVIPVKKILSNSNLFQHPTLEELRLRVSNGDYSQCSKDCSILKRGKIVASKSSDTFLLDYDLVPVTLPEREVSSELQDLTMALENGCNLSCESCRTALLGNILPKSILSEGWRFFKKVQLGLEKISFGGTGEPLLVPEVISFLTSKPSDQLKDISIITNGQLLTPTLWKRVDNQIKAKLDLIISIDGNSEKTYEENRRGSSYTTLYYNLAAIKDSPPKRLKFNFVVQENNYIEIIDFIKTSKHFGASAHFYPLRNWSTYSASEYDARNIASSEHKKYNHFIEILHSKTFTQSKATYSEY